MVVVVAAAADTALEAVAVVAAADTVAVVLAASVSEVVASAVAFVVAAVVLAASASEDPDCQIVQPTLESVVSLTWLALGQEPRRTHQLTSIRLRARMQVQVLLQERQSQA